MLRITKLSKLPKNQSLIELLHQVTWICSEMALARTHQGTIHSFSFRVQTLPLSPHYKILVTVSCVSWITGVSEAAQTFLAGFLMLSPGLICGKPTCRFPLQGF